MITLTLVRHGESTDNLKTCWAGWKDAPLSNHGLNQAKAAGEFFAGVHIHTIITSPLKRAFTTAQQIHKNQPDGAKPPIVTTPLIREQHFGEAEGHPWMAPTSPSSTNSGRTGIIDPKTKEKSYPVQYGRQAKFPAGECLEDVAARTGEAFDTFVMPIVRESEGKTCGEVNVFFVSHGIAISETIGSIFGKCIGGDKVQPESWRGLKNTAWTRLVIGMKGETLIYVKEAMKEPSSSSAAAMQDDTGAIIADEVGSANPPLTEGEDGQPDAAKEILAKVVAVNQYAHLEGVIRQKGGIGSLAHDEKQKAITDFFGGGGSKHDKVEATAAPIPVPAPESAQTVVDGDSIPME
ncbi:hypothetical protein FRB97_006455 [Tulasnella sp. 331]|nr:hypothetical protein FRB97_006455 [Tulasnella sp. 331]